MIGRSLQKLLTKKDLKRQGPRDVPLNGTVREPVHQPPDSLYISRDQVPVRAPGHVQGLGFYWGTLRDLLFETFEKFYLKQLPLWAEIYLHSC